MNRNEKVLAFLALAVALSGCSWLSKPEILEALPEPIGRPEPPAPPREAGAVGAAAPDLQRGGADGARPAMPAGAKAGGG